MSDNEIKKPSLNINGAEIKRLAEDALKSLEPFEVRDIVARMQETINRQQAEIERLKNDCFCIANERDAIVDCLNTAVEEAIKEFAGMVKANKINLFNYIYSSRGFDAQIDKLVEEWGAKNDE